MKSRTTAPTISDEQELLVAILSCDSAWERAKVYANAGMKKECDYELSQMTAQEVLDELRSGHTDSVSHSLICQRYLLGAFDFTYLTPNWRRI